MTEPITEERIVRTLDFMNRRRTDTRRFEKDYKEAISLLRDMLATVR